MTDMTYNVTYNVFGGTLNPTLLLLLLLHRCPLSCFCLRT